MFAAWEPLLLGMQGRACAAPQNHERGEKTQLTLPELLALTLQLSDDQVAGLQLGEHEEFHWMTEVYPQYRATQKTRAIRT